MDVCAQCGESDGWVEDSGQRECSHCGYLEPIQQEVNDYMKGRTNKYKLEAKKASITNFYTANKEAVTRAYAYVLDSSVQDNAKILEQLCENPALWSAIGKIWLRTLEVSRIRAPGVLSEGLKNYRKSMTGRLGHLEEELLKIEDEGSDMIGNDQKLWKYVLWHLLDLESVVWVCFAACLYLREAVTPVDFSLWISKGVLPYMALGKHRGRVQEEFNVVLPPGVLRPHTVPPPSRILEKTLTLAEDIGLTLPEPNFPLHLMRYTQILELPAYVGEVAIELHRITSVYKFGQGPGTLSCTLDSFHNLGALLVVAVKFCYGLDGRGAERCAKHAPPPPASWLEWGQDLWKRRFSMYNDFHVTGEHLDGLGEGELGDIVKQYTSVMFADCEIHQGYQGVEKKVKKVFSASGIRTKKRKSKSTKSSHGAGQEQRGPTPEGQTEELHPEEEECAEGAEAGEASDVDSDGDWEDAPTVGKNALRFGIPDGPSYIPDSHLLPCSTYWLVPKRGNPNQTDWHLPIDYVVVLSIVSTLVGAKPIELQERIRGVESTMMDVEGHLPKAMKRIEEAEGAAANAEGVSAKQSGICYSRSTRRLTFFDALQREGMSKKATIKLLRFNAESTSERQNISRNRRPVAKANDNDSEKNGQESLVEPREKQDEAQQKGKGKHKSEKSANLGLEGDDMQSPLDDAFVATALTHYEGYLGRKAARNELIHRLGVGGVMSAPLKTKAFTDEYLKGGDISTSPMFNNIELFNRAKLAAKFRQPFVTIATDPLDDAQEGGRFAFDVRGAGEVELKEEYMSDVELDSEEDEG